MANRIWVELPQPSYFTGDVVTGAVALETDKGNFELALALGVILLVISFSINSILHAVQKKGTVTVS